MDANACDADAKSLGFVSANKTLGKCIHRQSTSYGFSRVVWLIDRGIEKKYRRIADNFIQSRAMVWSNLCHGINIGVEQRHQLAGDTLLCQWSEVGNIGENIRQFTLLPTNL